MSTESFCDATRRWLASGRHEKIGGRNVFVQDCQPRAEQLTLLLLHGYPTSSYDWRGVAHVLAGRARTIAADFLGFGLSDKPAAFGYSLFDQADMIEQLAARLGLEAVHLVSHDLGTSVHCELLARAAENRLGFTVRSNTFLNGSMLQWKAKITPLQELFASNATLPQAIELCRTSLVPRYVPSLQALMQRPEAITTEDAQVMNDLLAYQDGHLRLPALSGYMRERYLHADRWLGALENAPTPVQFVWGDGDPIAHAEMGRELACRCPRAKYHELAGLGHFLLIEDPSRVAEKIAAMMAVA